MPEKMNHAGDAVRYLQGQDLCNGIIPSAVVSCNENHVNEVKELRIDSPVLIGIDFANGPSRTVITEKLADGGLVIHEPGEISPDDWGRLLEERALDQFAKTAQAVKQVGDSFQELGMQMPNFMNVSVPEKIVSKHADGKRMPGNEWQKKKARRKLQAQSRKRNRS